MLNLLKPAYTLFRRIRALLRLMERRHRHFNRACIEDSENEAMDQPSWAPLFTRK